MTAEQYQKIFRFYIDIFGLVIIARNRWMLILGLWVRIFREPMPKVFLFFGIPVQLFACSGVGSTLDGCAMLRIFSGRGK
jgi:hypothetical protein